MIYYIKTYKHVIIIISIILLAIGSWYFLINRGVNEEPQKADLVFLIKLLKDV